MKRISFIRTGSLLLASFFLPSYYRKPKLKISTVKGLIDARKVGVCLVHEHILVDFIGAEKYDPTRWNRAQVVEKVISYLMELKKNGCSTFMECTPEYLGRDVKLLRALSEKTGLNILTNTGYYGAGNNKYIPEKVFNISAKQLAEIWIKEYEEGIQGTSIKPGFIKIGVNPGPLSDFHEKLVRSAGLTHLSTGLTITSHTGPSITAFSEIDVLKKLGVHPSAFIWIHAQNENDWGTYVKAAKMGAWVSLDGLNDKNVNEYIERLFYMKDNGLLEKTLVSHDAGWYDPGKPEDGTFRNFNTLFEKLIPQLKSKGFTQEEINQIMISNPVNAFSIRVRKI